MDVRDVELDDRAREHLERVEQRQRGEGERRRIDQQARRLVDRGMHQVDEALLAVGLLENQRTISRGLAADGFDLGKGRSAVDLGFALAQPVEVGTIENVDRLHVITLGIRTILAATAPDPARR